MEMHVRHIRDLILLNVVGLSLFTRIMKARERLQTKTRRKHAWFEENYGTIIGYEAGWPAVLLRRK